MNYRKLKFNRNQLALPFGERRRGVTLSIEDRQKAFWFLVSICFISLALYIYGINMTARNIAARQALETRAREVSANLSSLEFTYIELRNNVTMELAYQYGFKEVKKPLYVSRSSSQTALSFNTLER